MPQKSSNEHRQPWPGATDIRITATLLRTALDLNVPAALHALQVLPGSAVLVDALKKAFDAWASKTEPEESKVAAAALRDAGTSVVEVLSARVAVDLDGGVDAAVAQLEKFDRCVNIESTKGLIGIVSRSSAQALGGAMERFAEAVDAPVTIRECLWAPQTSSPEVVTEGAPEAEPTIAERPSTAAELAEALLRLTGNIDSSDAPNPQAAGKPKEMPENDICLLESAGNAHQSLHVLAEAEEKYRRALSDLGEKREPLREHLKRYAAVDDTAVVDTAAVDRTVVDSASRVRWGYSRSVLTDLIRTHRFAVVAGATTEEEIHASAKLTAKAFADYLLATVKGVEDAYDEIKMQADRIKHAPMGSSTSFDQWREARLALLTKLSHKLTRGCKLAHPLGKSASTTDRLLVAESYPAGNYDAVIKILDEKNRKATEFSHLVGSQDCGETLAEIVRDELLRLQAAQAAIPTLPSDWSKPAGTVLSLFVLGVVAYVLWGSLRLGQPLWAIVGAGDIADLLLHPAYIVALFYLVWHAHRALERVPEKHAKLAVRRIQRCLQGKPALYDRSGKTPLKAFLRSMKQVFQVSALIVVIGFIVEWEATVRFGGKVLRVSETLQCLTNERVFAFGKGFVSVPANNVNRFVLDGQVVFTKDPAGYLCGKKDSKPPTTDGGCCVTDTKSVAQAIAGVAASIRELRSMPPTPVVVTLDVDAAIEKLQATLRGLERRPPLRLSISIDELRACQSTPESATCALSSLLARLKDLRTGVDAVRDKLVPLASLTGLVTLMEEIEKNTREVPGIGTNFRAFIKDWAEFRSRNGLERVGEIFGRKTKIEKSNPP